VIDATVEVVTVADDAWKHPVSIVGSIERNEIFHTWSRVVAVARDAGERDDEDRHRVAVRGRDEESARVCVPTRDTA